MSGVPPGARLGAVVAIIALATGCSVVTVDATRRDLGVRSDCSRSLLPPVVDTVVTGWIVAAIAAGAADLDGPVPILAAPFAISAVTGFRERARCRSGARTTLVATTPTPTVQSVDSPRPPEDVTSNPVTRPAQPVAPARAPVTATVPTATSATGPRQEHTPERVVNEPPPVQTSTGVRLADEVVVRALGKVQPAFLQCFKRAQRLDPMLTAAKVIVHLDVDASGAVVMAWTNAEQQTFSNCLTIVARQLKFPSPGRPAVTDIPLLFNDD